MEKLDYSTISQGTICRGYTLSGDRWIDASGYSMSIEALHPDLENTEKLYDIDFDEFETRDEMIAFLVKNCPKHKRTEFLKIVNFLPLPDVEYNHINKLNIKEKEKEEIVKKLEEDKAKRLAKKKSKRRVNKKQQTKQKNKEVRFSPMNENINLK